MIFFCCIIEDFDFVIMNTFKKYKNKSKIIKKDNQDESGLVFALKNVVDDVKNINSITLLEIELIILCVVF